MVDKRVGDYSLVIGIVIAIILGLAKDYIPGLVPAWLLSTMVLLGLIVGFLNVTGKETKEFLLVGAILVIVAYAGGNAANLTNVMYIGPYLQGIFNYILGFLIPAMFVVSLKDIWRLAQA